MSVAAPLPVGFRTTDPWPASGVPVEYRPTKSADVLARVASGQSLYWAINPYSGCELACTHCAARYLPPFDSAEYPVFERDILMRVNAADSIAQRLREGDFKNVPVVLGTATDPWQPVEKKANLTRSVLEMLSRFEGIDLRAQTRTSLVTRDADLLKAIAKKGRVAVSFTIGSLDYRLTKLLEPKAPSPDHRFIAMEALARAGIRVGLVASPILPGLNDATPALEQLLRRARDAGASFAVASPLVMTDAARAKLVAWVGKYDPELATRYDRVLARTGDYERGFARKLNDRFAELRERAGLASSPHPAVDWSPRNDDRPQKAGPEQLSLW